MNKLLFSMIALSAFIAVGTLVYKAQSHTPEAPAFKAATVSASSDSCCDSEGAASTGCCGEAAVAKTGGCCGCCSGKESNDAALVSTEVKTECDGKCEEGCCGGAAIEAKADGDDHDAQETDVTQVDESVTESGT